MYASFKFLIAGNAKYVYVVFSVSILINFLTPNNKLTFKQKSIVIMQSHVRGLIPKCSTSIIMWLKNIYKALEVDKGTGWC